MTYHPNEAGLAELARAPFIAKELRRRAESVKAAAIALPPGDESGEYSASFVVTSGVEDGKAFGRVTNTSDHAVYIEFGTEDTPTFRTLGKALAAAAD